MVNADLIELDGDNALDLFVPAHFSPIKSLHAPSSPVRHMKTPDRQFDLLPSPSDRVHGYESLSNSSMGKRKIALLSGHAENGERDCKSKDLHERVLKLARDCNFDMSRFSSNSCGQEREGKSTVTVENRKEQVKDEGGGERHKEQVMLEEASSHVRDHELIKCCSVQEQDIQLQPRPPSAESKFLRRDPRRKHAWWRHANAQSKRFTTTSPVAKKHVEGCGEGESGVMDWEMLRGEVRRSAESLGIRMSSTCLPSATASEVSTRVSDMAARYESSIMPLPQHRERSLLSANDSLVRSRHLNESLLASLDELSRQIMTVTSLFEPPRREEGREDERKTEGGGGEGRRNELVVSKARKKWERDMGGGHVAEFDKSVHKIECISIDRAASTVTNIKVEQEREKGRRIGDKGSGSKESIMIKTENRRRGLSWSSLSKTNILK
ncbi:hypothetical protein GUITHDRAFT_106173 [Guillardia theta CCMP2712]|uniref:Uncharacterized protein n=1 Tax=Guillardia theta (strain CCMP2712) TaxID=905079 RepID=L1JIW3_GUITC|nr:hypothetical protein GUITHDRAFT_106173 [Guillardia theta CCMP2712]EKX48094.1 hypothetical protein GUITHDRAFT_106173 [Guillardia theta CCMP2712]|eukprot:XP_005835074.1 hypothetical protein GUITHDRAFT_106173 [Guillardia theta CCMP2712]